MSAGVLECVVLYELGSYGLSLLWTNQVNQGSQTAKGGSRGMETVSIISKDRLDHFWSLDFCGIELRDERTPRLPYSSRMKCASHVGRRYTLGDR